MGRFMVVAERHATGDSSPACSTRTARRRAGSFVNVTSFTQDQPAVAADASGNVVVWRSVQNSVGGRVARRQPPACAGNRQRRGIQVNVFTSGTGTSAASRPRNAFVSLDQRKQPGRNAFYARASSHGAPPPANSSSTPRPNDQDNSTVGMDSIKRSHRLDQQQQDGLKAAFSGRSMMRARSGRCRIQRQYTTFGDQDWPAVAMARCPTSWSSGTGTGRQQRRLRAILAIEHVTIISVPGGAQSTAEEAA
jgi:hypothetical protein